MAVVDARYRFLYANVGCQGRISDGGVTQFAKKLNAGTTLNLSLAKLLPGHRDKTTGCSNVHFITGYHEQNVENTFGLMSSVFRVLRKPLLLQPVNSEKIVLAYRYLHIFL